MKWQQMNFLTGWDGNRKVNNLKKIKSFINNCSIIMFSSLMTANRHLGNGLKSTKNFITDFLEDIFIVVGILLIVGATFIMFGIAPAMYALGGVMITLGVKDSILYRKGR